MRNFSLVLFFVITAGFISGQEKIEFPSSDGIVITADQYKISDDATWIVLCHQARSSRGEYKEIAPKLNKLGFNCLAVDLRSGSEMNFVENETAKRAKEKSLPTSYLAAEKDIVSAIEFIYKSKNKPLILFGSSYSASLALKIAPKNEKIKAVVVFSPGEYLTTEGVTLKSSMPGFDKSVYAACTANEYDVMNDLFLQTVSTDKVLYRPQEGGTHGAKALWKETEHSKEVWFELTMFLAKHK